MIFKIGDKIEAQNTQWLVVIPDSGYGVCLLNLSNYMVGKPMDSLGELTEYMMRTYPDVKVVEK